MSMILSFLVNIVICAAIAAWFAVMLPDLPVAFFALLGTLLGYLLTKAETLISRRLSGRRADPKTKSPGEQRRG